MPHEELVILLLLGFAVHLFSPPPLLVTRPKRIEFERKPNTEVESERKKSVELWRKTKVKRGKSACHANSLPSFFIFFSLVATFLRFLCENLFFCIALFLLFFDCMPHNHGNKGDLLPVVWVEQQKNKKKMCSFLLLINIDINWVDLEWRYERWMWFYCLRLNRIFFLHSRHEPSTGQERKKLCTWKTRTKEQNNCLCDQRKCATE